MTTADLPDDLRSAGLTTRSGVVELATDDEVEVVHRLTGWAIDQHVALQGLTITRITLEDIYLRLTTPGYGGDGRALTAPDVEASR